MNGIHVQYGEEIPFSDTFASDNRRSDPLHTVRNLSFIIAIFATMGTPSCQKKKRVYTAANYAVEIPVVESAAVVLPLRGATGAPITQQPLTSIAITSEEKEHIRYIIHTLGEMNLIALWRHEGELNSRGNLVRHIHPLRFLAECLQQPQSFRKLRSRSMIWGRFIADLTKHFDQKKQENQILPYIDSFAQTVGANI
ncbi:MAG: hypothetical protein RL235_781, partial [Chlamydiota bacterium]